MAIALVGSMGTTATGTTSVSPTFGQATTAGNLLILWTIDNGGTLTPPAGWSTAIGGSNSVAKIYYKPNCGAGESAPTLTDLGATFMAARLAEFSGVVTSSPVDRNQSSVVTSSPAVLDMPGVDVGSGELLVSLSYLLYSMAATKTTSDTYNNGATPTNSVSNDATSTTDHYRMAWGLTTGNSVADQNSFAFTITNISTTDFIIVSFKAVAVAGPTAQYAQHPLGLTSGGYISKRMGPPVLTRQQGYVLPPDVVAYQPRSPATNFQDPAIL